MNFIMRSVLCNASAALSKRLAHQRLAMITYRQASQWLEEGLIRL
jgi:hypothetical protein